jgi:cellulose synthase/poly-beta-1,6-N-acetylglucosamine synthase-like glycosyltransferase
METAIWYLAVGFAATLAVPVAMYAAECVAGCLSARPTETRRSTRRPSVAVLVPAHNEESGIARTVLSVRGQMSDGDRLLVVADNCSDRTAEVARVAGAEVIERRDPSRRGKGFALDFGLACLASSPRSVVVFVDADCTLLPGSLDVLAHKAGAERRPVQSCNLMIAPEEGGRDTSVAEFAFLVKNYVRPRGMARMGLPCQLTGTGMAIPWSLTDRALMATDQLAEDMQLGLDLAATGNFPIYCEEAGVRSRFPETAANLKTQRSRWEVGHLRLVMSGIGILLRPATWRSPRYLAMVLDVMVPPLTLLVLLIGAAALLGAVGGVIGAGWGPLVLALVLGIVVVGSTLLAWSTHGRSVVSAQSLLRIPAYVASKVWIYPRALLGRSNRSWIRTGRDGAHQESTST